MSRRGGPADTRHPPLDMPADEFRRLGTELVEAVASLLESLPDRPVTTRATPPQIRETIGGDRSLPARGTDAGALLDSTARLLFENSLFNGHPAFYGYITSSPAPIGMLGDFLAAAVNANVGAWRLSPIATEIEAQTVRWIGELIGYASGCGGLFVSGGNMANMVGLFAARARAASWDVRSLGMMTEQARPLRVYASGETHTWLQKATDLSGLGTDSIRWIPTDPMHRLDTDELRSAIRRDRAAGEVPMLVVGTAGTVSTGVVDPLTEIGRICQDEGVWFHVDGAYGAFAAGVPGTPPDLRELALADSVAVDPHKWLYAPIEAGCLLVRDPEHLSKAFSYHPPYYHFGHEATNYFDLGPQNSRGFRALKVWLALQQVGRDGYLQMIGDDIRLSQRLFRVVQETPDLDAVTQALSITTFRFVPPELRSTLGQADTESYLNRLNEEILDRVQMSGEAFVSNAVVRGMYLLRACIVNFRTSQADVDALPGIVTRIGREVRAES